eukprot:m.63186 g.63186  ORF g.63186 m.63186 type:complete len:443 (-) comp23253_c0_seq1:239-1567(-)
MHTVFFKPTTRMRLYMPSRVDLRSIGAFLTSVSRTASTTAHASRGVCGSNPTTEHPSHLHQRRQQAHACSSLHPTPISLARRPMYKPHYRANSPRGARAFSHSTTKKVGYTLCPPDRIPTTEELHSLHTHVKQTMVLNNKTLESASKYYFDGKGKLLRPLIVTLVGRACRNANTHESTNWPDQVEQHQNTIACITEMIHTSSLVHDDVIDEAASRRNKASVNQVFTEKQCVLAGDFILARATYLLAKIGHPRVIEIFARVIEDLVRGELMQLGTAQDPEQRFANYIKKSEAKTARLLAHSCHTVAVLAEASDEMETAAFEYGRNLGIAFQLIDDLLDVVQSSASMGKETSVDMKLGLATAPVLFASEEFPELVPLMMRQFREEGDVALARELIMKSDGIERTRELAAEYASEAIKQAESMPGPQLYITALTDIAKKLLNRQA